MKRRDFLKIAGAVSTHSLLPSLALNSLWIPSAHGESVPLASLQNALHPEDALILLPDSSQFANYQAAFNKRTMKVPLVRVLIKNAQGAATAIQWAKANHVPLATRSGGHSFEGLSQTTGLAIDTRLLNKMMVSGNVSSFIAQAGCRLGSVYQTLSGYKKAIPAGSCPSVGITGHTLGGGYGLLARPFGLACDSLLSIQLVKATGEIVNCSQTENSDLFWALRGGGAGSFGVVTQMQFRTHDVSNVLTYGVGWKVSAKIAAQLMKAWQQWAPSSPQEITSLMKISRSADGLYGVRCIGQSIGSEAQLRKELSRLTALSTATISVKAQIFMDAVKHFGGSFEAESIYMKGKSDYIKQVMSDIGLQEFLQKIPSGIDVIFDSYGGAISNLKSDETAFVHRAGTLSSLQYYTQWDNSSQGPAKLAAMKNFHETMRPHMSGSAYFNYCDLDIANWGEAYWGDNLNRLIEIKNAHDPENLFNHAQSIPLKYAK